MVALSGLLRGCRPPFRRLSYDGREQGYSEVMRIGFLAEQALPIPEQGAKPDPSAYSHKGLPDQLSTGLRSPNPRCPYSVGLDGFLHDVRCYVGRNRAALFAIPRLRHPQGTLSRGERLAVDRRRPRWAETFFRSTSFLIPKVLRVKTGPVFSA